MSKASKRRAFSYIRFSSAQQAEGGSLVRQSRLTQEFCDRKGLTLDDTLTLNDLRQNGAPQGDFKSLTIDDSGAVIVTFDNGNIRKLYQIPIATFANPDELDRVNGNAFVATPGSGAAVFKFPGESGAGDLVSAAIDG